MRCVVLGGGGHARVVIDAIQASGEATTVAILDADRSRWGTELQGVPITGGDDQLAAVLASGVTHFVVGIGSVRDTGPRRRLFERASACGLTALLVRHPSAVSSPWARMGGGSVLLANAVVNAGATVGENVIVNTGAIVEHDCLIGDHVHIATGARLASGVRVGMGAHVGAGAVVRQQIVIGEEAVVGAGAVVVRDVAPRTVVVGVPARPLEIWAGRSIG
ncbi:MAG: NeuD/PglB/VioB family sugar acetyltransferase [Gemmatimonadetes bacterium]|nr:NeuD/PglB/VioB family sugar acetyltransferase [Gemmatimonadota bacterium]